MSIPSQAPLRENWRGGRACAVGFSEFKLIRIIAPVFTFNPASAKVLEKNGFSLEGILKKDHLKNGRHIDCFPYAKLATGF